MTAIMAIMTAVMVAAEGTGLPAAFSSVLQEVWSQITTCMSTISSTPLLLLGIGVSFAGAIVGLAKRFLRFGGGRRR